MRLYMGDASDASLAKCRERAPSHSFGRVWTPAHNRGGCSYIVDNGVYQAAMNDDEWSVDRWTALLDKVEEHPWPPDFVVLPDAYGDAEATLQKHREHIDEVVSRGFRPAYVLQPGLDESTQVRLADQLGADVIFIGGPNRWKRALGEEIVADAHERGLAVHVGNPGVPGGLEWACQIGVDSLDTSSIVGSEAYHHLDELDTPSSRGSRKKTTRQGRLVTDGGRSATDV